MSITRRMLSKHQSVALSLQKKILHTEKKKIMALVVSYEQHFISKMIEECWDKLEKDCISLDELVALQQAFDSFPDVDSRQERLIVQGKIEELRSNSDLASAAEARSDEYTTQRLKDEVDNQPDPSVFSEAEESPEEGTDEEDE